MGKWKNKTKPGSNVEIQVAKIGTKPVTLSRNQTSSPSWFLNLRAIDLGRYELKATDEILAKREAGQLLSDLLDQKIREMRTMILEVDQLIKAGGNKNVQE